MTSTTPLSRRTLLQASMAAGVALAAPGLASCSSTQAAQQTSGDATTIELWARGATGTGDAYNKFLPQLQSDTGLKINFRIVQTFDQELQSRAQTKSIPDMWINDDVLMGTYQRQGLIRAVNQADVTDAAKILPNLWEQAKGTDGKLYAVPFSRQTMVNLVRSDWLTKLGLKAPTTWEEYVAFLDACAAKDPDGNGNPGDTYGTSVYGTVTNGYMARWAMSYIWQGGGQFWTANGGKYAADTTGEKTVAAVQWLQGLFAKPGRTQPGALTADTNASSGFFSEGKAGSLLTGPYAFIGHDNNPGKDKYTVIAPPKGPGGGTVLAEGENIYVSAGTTKLDAVKKAINWLTSAAGQKAAMTNGVQPVVRIPVRSDLDAASTYNDQRWSVVQESLKNGSNVFPAVSDVAAMKSTIAQSLNKIMAAPTTDPRAELGNLKTALDKIFKDAGLQ